MKTIAPAAMAAIEAGEAIVTGAVEIFPTSLVYSFSTVETVDLDAVTNAATTPSGASAVGVTVGGFDPTDILRFTMPGGGAFTAWNDGGAPGWVNEFDVITDGDVGGSVRISGTGVVSSSTTHGTGFATAALALAAFGIQSLSGGSSYTFYINDSPISDNSGGLSILLEKGVPAGGSAAGPIRVWGGYGTTTFATDSGGQAFKGIGGRGLAQQNAGAIGGVAQGMTLGLSGIEAAALALLDGSEVKNAAIVVYRMIFASDGKTLLDAHRFDRGRGDTVGTDETIGGEASIAVGMESAARGLGRAGARMRADSDQRLISPTDGYFKNTGFAPFKSLYWGGKRPAIAGGALGGGSSGDGGANLDIVTFSPNTFGSAPQ